MMQCLDVLDTLGSGAHRKCVTHLLGMPLKVNIGPQSFLLCPLYIQHRVNNLLCAKLQTHPDFQMIKEHNFMNQPS